MYEERNIILFKPFHFKDGSNPKNKFFVVLKNIDGFCILASLPTSNITIPQNIYKNYGCIESIENDLNCFVIPPNITVTDCEKSFDLDTLLHGTLIDKYSVESLIMLHPIENEHYEIWGKMKKGLFRAIVGCFANSSSVKNKYKKILK